MSGSSMHDRQMCNLALTWPMSGFKKWLMLAGCSACEKLRVSASSSTACDVATNTPDSPPFSRRRPGFSTTFRPCTKPANADYMRCANTMGHSLFKAYLLACNHEQRRLCIQATRLEQGAGVQRTNEHKAGGAIEPLHDIAEGDAHQVERQHSIEHLEGAAVDVGAQPSAARCCVRLVVLWQHCCPP